MREKDEKIKDLLTLSLSLSHTHTHTHHLRERNNRLQIGEIVTYKAQDRNKERPYIWSKRKINMKSKKV